MKINLIVLVLKENDEYIATCGDLDLCSHGKTIEESEEMFFEAFKMWIENCLKRKILKKALIELDLISKDTVLKEIKNMEYNFFVMDNNEFIKVIRISNIF